MKRKDGQPKAKSLRNLPRFDVGHKDSENGILSGFSSSVGKSKSVLSLFSGCGGLDLGFLGGFEVFGVKCPRTEFEVVEAIDFDADCTQCYALNIGSSKTADLSDVSPSQLPSCQILIGGFPCQDFSSSGTKKGMSTERGQLYQVLVNYAADHHPQIVVAENVPYLERLHDGVYLREIANDFDAIGYGLSVWKIVCQDHGLPQSRTRLFLIGQPKSDPLIPRPIFPRIRKTIYEALSDLEAVTDESIPNQSQYFIASVASEGGGQGDHKNPTTGGVAYTIRANARGRIQFHHNLDRRLTVRECARLQSFPDSFVFPFGTQRNLKLIGNAVPPLIGNMVAVHIQDWLNGKLGEGDNAIQRELALF